MKQLNVWRKRIAAGLEWSPVDKALVLMAMAIPLYVQYLVWSLFVINRPDRDALVHVDVVRRVMEIELLLIAIGSMIFLAGVFLRHRRPKYLPFQHATLQFYSLSLVLMSYSIGTLSFPVGVVLLGAPIFGFILLDRWAVWCAVLSSTLLLLALNYAAAVGHIPYAPSKVTPTSTETMSFWMLSELFFAAPFLIIITFLADQMLTWWRAREDHIRELSRSDGLTGLANRRHILGKADKAARAARDSSPLACVILDLDHFKRVNDSHGHATGDRVLKASAECLTAMV
ncbi:MAG: GGDEF domain-containing protein, partial [Paraperlucidibaca sp.]